MFELGLWEATDPSGVAAEVHARGAALVRSFVPPALLESLVRPLPALLPQWIASRDDGLATPSSVPVVAEPPWSDPAWLALQRAVATSPSMDVLRAFVRASPVIQAVAGGDIDAARGDVVRIHFPGRTAPLATQPHQDAAYLAVPNTYILWFPLVACPIELGPLAVALDSHHAGLRPHSGSEQALAAPLVPERFWAAPMAVGDAAVVSAMTVHAGLANRTSDRVRLSLDLRFGAKRPGF